MTPATVGRIVLFRARDVDAPLPAIVCVVHGDSMVDVTVFDRTPRYESSVRLMQEEDHQADFVTRYCHWMPYQIAAAKKYPI